MSGLRCRSLHLRLDGITFPAQVRDGRVQRCAGPKPQVAVPYGRTINLIVDGSFFRIVNVATGALLPRAPFAYLCSQLRGKLRWVYT